MDKRLIYPQYNLKGDRDVFSVTEDRRWLQKTASSYHPEIQSYIDKAKPLSGLIQVLLTALGAHEYWGQNVNGDRFYEAALKHPGEDYGYKTFHTNANYFTHHVNKDPLLAKGKVLHAVWNDKAKRVELIVGINPEKDPDAAKMLDNGEALCFSMGARLPYDVCTVCQNKARTRAEYCDHLRYQMNQIDPTTGILVGAVNPFPKFFDISRVLIPADKTAYMWEKIAHAAAHPLAKVGSAELAETSAGKWLDDTAAHEKVAADTNIYSSKTSAKTSVCMQKSAELRKRIPVVARPIAVAKLKEAITHVKQALDASAVEIPREVFSGGPSLSQCVNSMVVLGLTPTARETQHLIDIFSREDGSLPKIAAGPSELNVGLLKELAPYAESRSYYRPVALQQLAGLNKQAAAGAVVAAPVKAGKAITEGVFAALGALFGITGSLAPQAKAVVTEMPTGLAGLISKHPVLAGILGAMALKALSNPPKAPKPLVSGNFTVADPTRGFYNNDWQRRFIEMQNRPVTVIKTGAAEGKSEYVPSPQAEYLISPLTYLFMTADLAKTADMQRSWEMIADQVIESIQSSETKEIVKSASRIAGNDLHEMSFTVPEIADLEIIKHVLNLTKVQK